MCSKVKDLYKGPLFLKSLAYAQSLNPDEIYVLSAKYGLLELNKTIEPYDLTLNNFSKSQKIEWSAKVIKQLNKKTNVSKDHFIFLTGNNYNQYLTKHLFGHENPLKGLPIGKRLSFLNSKISENNICEKLHLYFNKLQRFSFPFQDKEIPKNGIYILFEKGELSHKGDKIVRVGTHTGDNQLRSRLKQHFLKENKDRSIFRKNIGRAILNKKKDPYLRNWEIDLTTKLCRETLSHLVDTKKQRQIESKVSKYIQDHFSFAIVPVKTKRERLYLESRLISTISLCNKCAPSKSWLGRHSQKNKIKESGLWQVNELYKEPFSSKEFNSHF